MNFELLVERQKPLSNQCPVDVYCDLPISASIAGTLAVLVVMMVVMALLPLLSVLMFAA